MGKKILIVDDEEALRYTLNIFLGDEGYHVELASSYNEAVDLLTTTSFDLMFIDIIMEGKSGLELLRTIKEKTPNAQVIIITGAPSIATAAEAVRLGALDYIIKPIRQSEILKSAAIALRHKELSDEKDRFRHNIETIFKCVQDGIISVDSELRVIDSNDAAKALCGFRKGDKLETGPMGVGIHCCGTCLAILEEALTSRKNSVVHHIECHRKDLQEQIVSINISPLLDHLHNFSGCVMVIRDETQLCNLQRKAKENMYFNRMIGVSEEMRKVKDLIKIMAPVQTTLLITGESGTGKELVVDALHSAGDRAHGPLVKVNCGALSDSLLESELFGHVRGSFTGAVNDRIGRFHQADGGVIFLDEIGDVSPKMQLQLLRIIETMCFERVGSSTTEKVDVRIVAATNANLADKVAIGAFRLDLYYRLKIVEIALPPLRERKDDIVLITNHLILKFNRKFDKTIKAVSSEVEKFFLQYAWPGNVREFENCMEYASLMCKHNIITVDHLPAVLQKQLSDPDNLFPINEDQEEQCLRVALSQTDGNKAKAARLLGISRRTIYRKMLKYNIEP